MGPFSMELFHASLEPVTVVHASKINGLQPWKCPDHGDECEYEIWPEAEYVVLGGQHRTLEGGKKRGPDWEFSAVERTTPIHLAELGTAWWVSEQRRAPGVREKFNKKVQDGVPEYLEMAAYLKENGLTHARKGDTQFIEFGALVTLENGWRTNTEAAKIMIRTVGQSQVKAQGTIARALIEMAIWDIQDNSGTRVKWTGTQSMATKLAELSGRLKGGQNTMGVPGGDVAWRRAANWLGVQYNMHRRNGIDWPTWGDQAGQRS
jgi:hypothetical protein